MTATAVSVLSTSRLVSRNHSTAGSPGGGAVRAHGPLTAPPVRRRRGSAAPPPGDGAPRPAPPPACAPGGPACRWICAARSGGRSRSRRARRRRRRAWRRTASGRPWRSQRSWWARTSTSTRFRRRCSSNTAKQSASRSMTLSTRVLRLNAAAARSMSRRPSTQRCVLGAVSCAALGGLLRRLGGRLLRRRRWLVRRACRAARRRLETAAQHAQRQTRAIDRQGQMQMQAERLRGRLVAPDDAQPLAVRARRKIQIRPVLDGCGREPGCPGPPAQSPYVRVNAYGSYLGWLTANRVASQLAVSAQPPVTRRPGPASGACFGLADSPWLRPFPPATPQAFARPCSPPSPVLLPHPTSSFRASSDTESSFPLRPRFDCRGRMKTSQVPTKDVRTCMGSPTPWSPPSPHHCGDVGVAFDRL